ncbi:MAG: hypothetical protein JSW28_10595 [Thermoplasmata archaeon]|nr:MAG: hypothetical protein JSW28_10595 [Thermoplasmata archaeon]
MSKRKTKEQASPSEDLAESAILDLQTRQDRENAEASIARARQLTEHCRYLDIVVLKAGEQLECALERFEDGNYKESKRKADQAFSSALQIEEQWQEAKPSVDLARNKKRELFISGVEIGDADPLIDEMDEKFEAGDYGAAKEIADRALAIINEIEHAWQDAKPLIDKAFFKFKDLAQKEIVFPDAEQMMGELTEKLNCGDYPEAKEIADRVVGTAVKIENSWEESKLFLEKAHDIMEEVKELGVAAESAGSDLAEAEKAFQSGIYSTSKELAERAFTTANAVEKSWRKAKSALNMAKVKVEECTTQEIVCLNAEALFKDACGKFEAGNYEEAKSLAYSILDMLAESEKGWGEARPALENAKKKVEELKAQNVHIAPAENDLVKAQDKYNIGSYFESKQIAKDVEKLASEVERAWKEARLMVEKVKRKIESLYTQNIVFKDSDVLLAEMNAEYNRGNYEQSKKMAEEAFRTASDIEGQWQGAKESITAAKEAIASGLSMGFHLARAEEEMSRAEELYESGDYTESRKIAREVLHNVTEDVNTYSEVPKVIQETKALIEDARQRNVPIPEELFGNAISAFQSQNYDVALDFAKAAQHSLEKAFSQQKKASATLKTCSESIDKAEQYIFTDEVKKMLDDAYMALDKGDFDGSITMAKGCEEETQRLIREGEPIISVAIPTENIQARIFNRCTLTVTNNGKVHAKDIHVEFQGKIEVEGLSTIPFLKANKSENVEFALKVNAEGSIPVRILVTCVNVANEKPYSTSESTWLSVGTAAPRVGIAEARILRETEFFRGFIRMKVAVQNDMPSVITDVTFKPIVDEKVFRLSHIEPDYIIKYGEILLGNVNPREKKTVAVYFDPMICTTSNLNGTISYKDSRGNFRTGVMKPKEVNVICPIFFTEDTANPAMLVNLVKNVLKHQDSKVFNIPQGLPPTKAFEITKEAIQQRHIKFIRDFHQKSPYIAEAWYYGITKVKQYQMVIRCDVREETNSIQIFVASSDERALTGLLAELGHNLEKALKEKGISQPITQVTNITIKDSIVQRSSLLFGTEAEGETRIEGSVIHKSSLKKQEKEA